ncbi:asparaginase [Sutterella sp.]|uniref:asparaginase n=1 Tax=Sutterella sp. TaxID=1981025 RepID=UPI0026DF49CF|nr:asparaginase [Sutterella sp.]MDO5532384.1 asparaginase [Sutterella sp.]
MKTILMLTTGGTIVSSGGSATQMTGYSIEGVRVEDVLAAVPGIGEIARIRLVPVANIPSSDMNWTVWLALARTIEAECRTGAVDGVVITHGTDTMEETGFALNLLLKTDIPVVLTGAMRPSTAVSADGPVNLLDAVTVAASDEARGAGVMVVMNGRVFSARDVTKTITTDVDTFASRDFGPLGFVLGGRAEFFMRSIRPHTVGTEFSLADLPAAADMPRVDVSYAYGGDDGLMIRSAVAAGAKGIIYVGTGHATVSAPAEKAILEARARGIVVIRTSRTGAGRVLEGLERWQQAGFIPAGTLNPQKARILAQLALQKFADADDPTGEVLRCFRTY